MNRQHTSSDRRQGAAVFIGKLALLAMASVAASANRYVATDLGSLGGRNIIATAINPSGQVTGVGETTGNAHQHAFLGDGAQLSDLGTLAGVPDSDSLGAAINSVGVVAGDSQYAIGPEFVLEHVFITSPVGLSDLGSLGGALVSVAAINDAGQVAGWSYIEPSGQHAFVTRGSVMTDLGTFGGFNSYATAINAAGQVTGYAFLVGDQTAHAFISRGARLTDLGTLGGPSSLGLAIDSRGQVTGYSDTSATGGLSHAFVTTASGMVDLGTLGGPTSQGLAINNSGQVTGNSQTRKAGTTHAFIATAGQMTDLGTLGGTYSAGTAINNQHAVVGSAYTANNASQHAFVYKSGVMIDLNVYLTTSQRTTYVLQEAVAINDSGAIVVNAINHSTRALRVFRLIPSPVADDSPQ